MRLHETKDILNNCSATENLLFIPWVVLNVFGVLFEWKRYIVKWLQLTDGQILSPVLRQWFGMH